MMHRRNLLSLSALLVAGGLAASTLPSVAGAAESAAAAPRPGLLFDNVKGTFKARGNASGAFKGDLLVQKVLVDRDKRNLKVSGRLAGTSGGVGSFDSQSFSSTAELSSKGTSSGTTCGALTFDFSTIKISLRDTTVDLSDIKANSANFTGTRGKDIAAQLCKLSDLLEGDDSLSGTSTIVKKLNQLLAAGLTTAP